VAVDVVDGDIECGGLGDAGKNSTAHSRTRRAGVFSPWCARPTHPCPDGTLQIGLATPTWWLHMMSLYSTWCSRAAPRDVIWEPETVEQVTWLNQHASCNASSPRVSQSKKQP